MSMNVDILLGVILVALVTEAIVNGFKKLVPSSAPPYVPVIMSLVSAVVLCVLAGLDIMAGFGYPLAVPYVGSIFAGVLASLGANTVYDIIAGFRGYKNKLAKDSQSANTDEEYVNKNIL